MDKLNKVAIIGSGYVGLTTAAVLSKIGIQVWCVDIDQKKVDSINSGKSHFYEPLLDEYISAGVDSGNLIATTSYEEALTKSNAQLAIICVGTPAREDGSSNLDYIFSAVKSVGKYAKQGLILTTKSTVPPGTGKKITELLADNKRTDISILSTPEFLAEGSAILDSFNIDRLVVGGDDESSKQAYIRLFKQIDDYAHTQGLDELKELNSSYRNKFTDHTQTKFEDRVVNVSLESAELIKVTANAFLATKISFANSIARITDKIGADVNEVMDGIGMDPRIGRSFLYAGLGWGGGCFPKDVSSLISYADSVGFDFQQLKATADINFDQINYAFDKVLDILNVSDQDSVGPNKPLSGKILTLWGLSFKPGTNDIRMSPSIALLRKLLEAGATVKVHDPQVKEVQLAVINWYSSDYVIYTHKIEDSVKDSEIIVHATDWAEYASIDFNNSIFNSMVNKILLDLRNGLENINQDGGIRIYNL